MAKQSMVIGWLYPELMNTYGDRGNVMILASRVKLRGIEVTIKALSLVSRGEEILDCDLLFMGGAQDSQQIIVYRDLLEKRNYLKSAIDQGTPGLYICGAYQLLGKHYLTAEGVHVEGLNIFDLYTENPGSDAKRLVGNIISRANLPGLSEAMLIGFENHGGRTYLGSSGTPLAEVIVGAGNNGEDGSEGAVLQNSVGTYLHGPILAKNPALADWLLSRSLAKKYLSTRSLKPLDDKLEISARKQLSEKLLVGQPLSDI